MKIRIVSFSDDGGAGIAAQRISDALHREGVDVKLLLANGSLNEPYKVGLKPDPWTKNRLVRLFRHIRAGRIFKKVLASRPIEHPVFSMPWGDYEQDLIKQLKDADIIHLHWVSGLMELKSFLQKVNPCAQIFWTLHDMNPLTGGYHYQQSLKPDQATAFEIKSIDRKKQAIHSVFTRMTCCAPSRWLADLARQSSVFEGIPTHVIRNCLDLDTFQPGETALAKKFLGLNPDIPALLFVNHNNDDPNKGLTLLLEAIELLKSEEVKFQCITVGKNGSNSDEILHLGSITEPRLMAKIYTAADLFVIPSLLDNYPNTVIEAFACGVPAVGYKTGGIPEQIIHEQTGLLFEEHTAKALSKQIKELIENPEMLNRMRDQCRTYAERENDPAIVAKKHLALYKDAMHR